MRRGGSFDRVLQECQEIKGQRPNAKLPRTAYGGPFFGRDLVGTLGLVLVFKEGETGTCLKPMRTAGRLVLLTEAPLVVSPDFN